jgi:LSM domain
MATLAAAVSDAVLFMPCSDDLCHLKRRSQYRGEYKLLFQTTSMLCQVVQLQRRRANGLLDLQGTLRGYDQATNLILDDAVERVYSTKVREMKMAVSCPDIASGNWERCATCACTYNQICSCCLMSAGGS